MQRNFFESDEELLAALAQVKAMAPATRKLLAECVEHTTLTRKSLSKAASTLEEMGFIRVIEKDRVFEREFELRSTLWGEEALEAYDEGFTPAESSKAAETAR